MHASRYMTIATADEHGTPWVSPVWFAPEGDDAVLWVSDPGARHSRNIAARPRVAIVVFDSAAAPADAQGLYLTADAAEAEPAAIAAFSRESVAQGLAAWGVEDVTDSARHRLYRATLLERWALGPGDRRIPLA
jgi:predicted pyridoxine 5'-phosphate oxidase superfamily flavin-nucleotide-binding protein